MMPFLKEVPCIYLDTGGRIPDRCFFNMNTPETDQSLLLNTATHSREKTYSECDLMTVPKSGVNMV